MSNLESFVSQCVYSDSTNKVRSVCVPYISSNNIYCNNDIRTTTLNNYTISNDPVPSSICTRDLSGVTNLDRVSANSISVVGNNSHKITLNSPSTLSSDITLTLPDNVGSKGQVIVTDGTGKLSFANTMLLNVSEINRAIVPITSIVRDSNNNFVTRLGTPVSISGSIIGLTIVGGGATTSDSVTYTKMISLVRLYLNLRFTTQSKLVNCSVNLNAVGSAGGSRSSCQTIQKSLSEFNYEFNAETGGVPANSGVSVTISWGDSNAVSIVSGYMILQL